MPSCPSHALPPTVRGASLASDASSPQALRAAIPVDYLRCAVPTHMGGLGGGPEDLVPLMRSLCAQSLSAGVLFWCQRTAIEFLVQTFNVALREHLLPDLLSFQRAATAPLSLDAPALTAAGQRFEPLIEAVLARLETARTKARAAHHMAQASLRFAATHVLSLTPSAGGADQILTVRPSPAPGLDFEYVIHNADGGEVEHCGNGARCFVRYVRDKGLTDKSTVRVKVQQGEIELTMNPDGRVTVNMGAPIFDWERVPF
eukprot:gene37891-46757_t